MFHTLTARFQELFRRMRGEGRLDERTLAQGLREMRRALLEADVHLGVVKRFLEAVGKRARGEKVTESWTPTRQLFAIVQEELSALLSGGDRALHLSSSGTGRLLVVGLQGSGKTATSAKLGSYLRRRGRNPILVCADTRRPAAWEQLTRLAERSGVPCFPPNRPASRVSSLEVCRMALEAVRGRPAGVAVFDTAGRLHVDADLMEELRELRKAVEPDEVLLVADAMTGQDAVRSSNAFHQAIGLTGIFLSKLDGDTRGGAALSMVSVTGVPIKLCGIGEGPEDLEAFDPSRMASRILGMGDLEGLVQRMKGSLGGEQVSGRDAPPSPKGGDLEQLRIQIRGLQKAGPLHRLLEMLPGSLGLGDLSGAGDQLRETLAILDSMTAGERHDPGILNGSRRKRIARGSGTNVEQVNRFLKQHAQLRKILQDLPGEGMSGSWRKWRGKRLH